MSAARIATISFALFMWLHGFKPFAEGYNIPQQQQQQQRRQYQPQKFLMIDDPERSQIIANHTTTTTRQTFLRDTSSWFFFVMGSSMFRPDTCHAMVETIGKDPNCNDASCLGVWDGLLANCDHSQAAAGCVSSQDDTPGTFAEPWDYSDDTTIILTSASSSSSNNPDGANKSVQLIMDRLINAIQSISNQRGDKVDIILQEKRYLHVLFTDQQSGEISDGEFYITPNDTTIQFRLSSAKNNTRNTVDTSIDRSSRRFMLLKQSYKNIDRAELIRKELRWLKLPILRNRQRALFFVESNLDKFGPQSAALGPPEEMRINDIDGS